MQNHAKPARPKTRTMQPMAMPAYTPDDSPLLSGEGPVLEIVGVVVLPELIGIDTITLRVRSLDWYTSCIIGAHISKLVLVVLEGVASSVSTPAVATLVAYVVYPLEEGRQTATVNV